MFESITHNIRVRVTPRYVPEQSDPSRPLYFFAYQVEIENQADFPAQLLARHWVIQDGQGRTQEVNGDGVVGLQPIIAPGECFQYASFCPLSTPTGSMRGHYVMKLINGEEVEAEIPLFILAEPSHFH